MDQLKATLGPISGTLMMLNIVLGASLFILPGLAAQQTGPASIVYWLLAILLSLPLLVIFCYGLLSFFRGGDAWPARYRAKCGLCVASRVWSECWS